MANTTFRVGGGYTTFLYNGKKLAFVDVVRETGPRPVAAPQAVQPLDEAYPVEIALPAALEAGTIEITFREQWDTEVWEQLGTNFVNNDGTVSDLLGVFKAQLAQGAVTLAKFIGEQGSTPTRRIDYQNCYVVNVMVDETVNIGTMTFPKSIQLMYTRRIEYKI